ncbi:MAG TPA: RluA family pseudouridine synthase [Thermomicrobiales bacterium]|nr:RluA family pseudouridine synthase [Thermomicrobiales bacterium]
MIPTPWTDADEAEDDADEFVVLHLYPAPDDRNDRLDKYVARNIPDLSRSYLHHLIESGDVSVDGVTRRPAFKVTPGQVIEVRIPPPVEEAILPEAIPLNIVFEDADVIVLNKPAGLVVHPAPGHPAGTLVNALLHHAPEIHVGGRVRPGIVHRLDKDTSGLMVVAKTDRARNSLVDQWQARSVDKRYIALVHGVTEEDEATVDAPLGRDPVQRQRMAVTRSGREAVTHFTVRERFERATLLDVEIETGRTHQIRVHLQFIGHPVAGDTVYGAGRQSVSGLRRQFLHAARLGFDLPGGERVTFESALPRELSIVLERLRAAEGRFHG